MLDIKEVQNILFLRVPDKVILFDNQGNFLKRLNMAGKNSLAVQGENIYNIEDDKIVEYKWNTGMKTAFNLPSNTVNNQLKVHTDHIVFYNKDSLQMYRNPFSARR